MIKIAPKQRQRAREMMRERALQLVNLCLGQIGLMFLSMMLTFAAPLGGGTPFAMAFVSAAMLSGKHPLGLVLGCALGCPWFSGASFVEAAAPLMGCALICIGAIAMRFMPYFKPDADGVVPMRDVACMLLSCMGMLVSAVPFIREIPYDLMMAVVNAALASAAAPTLISLFTIRVGRKRLLLEEQIALALLALCVLMGCRLLPGLGMSIAHMMAALITLLFAACSPGAGAVAGILTGSLMTLLGDTPYMGVALGLGGLLSSAVKGLGHPAMALGFLASNAISLIYTGGDQFGVISPYAAVFAGVVFCVMPRAVVDKVDDWFVPRPPVLDSDRLIHHLRTDAEQKVRALGELFEEMSQGYEVPSTLPDEQVMVAQMRAKLCEECSAYEKCWGGTSSRAGRLLVELLSDALCGKVMDAEASELPPDICRKCRRANQIPRRLGPMLNEFDGRRRAARERGECKVLLASQFKMASEALLSEGDRLSRPMRLDKELADRACAALDNAGLSAGGVWAVEDDLPQLFIGLRDKFWSSSSAVRAARGLTSSLGVQMKANGVALGAQDGELFFTPAPVMRVEVGFAGKAGGQGGVSGDSHVASELSDGRVLLALSDGMGSGAEAQAESAQALRLLKRFLGAGLPSGMALSAINELLLLRNGDEMFATADLCVLDLTTCRAEFSKLGSCASVILRRDRVMRIEGGKLPMGVLGKVVPVEVGVRLQMGDLVVMVTDGVCDGSSEEQGAWLEMMVRKYREEEPKRICERLVEGAASRVEKHKDDMTAIVARICEPSPHP